MNEPELNVDDDLLEQPPEGEVTPTPTEGEPTPPAKPDEMKTALADLAKHVEKVTAPKVEPAKELSQEEKDELWGVWNPEKANPDFFKKWMRLAADMDPNEVQSTIAERKALFAEMQKGFVRQAVVGARNLFTMELDKLREELKPTQDYVSTAKSEATRSRFYKEYTVLDDPKYAKVIDATARLLADKEFKDEAEYFKALAEGAADTIKGVLPEFDLGAGKTKTTKTAATTPRLPRTSAGGTGGAGGGARQQVEQTADAAGSVLD